jgi:hypothetical protein
LASRFHIDELISQDASGVIFRAVDQQTDEPVTLRRVFPYGLEGGGLQGDERTAYDIAIQRLQGATHPALRTVIDGGCDPIDGVPFVVTEWIDGQSLAVRVAKAPLASKQAIEIVMLALDISLVLSQLFAEQAIWIETDLNSIVESTGQPGREITFWISPLKWLGTDEDRRSLKPIVQLTEDLMGWKNKLVNDQAGNGLAGWVKWLKQHARKTTIKEARETLAAATGMAPPNTAKLVPAAARPTPTRKVTSAAPTKPAATRSAVTSPAPTAKSAAPTKGAATANPGTGTQPAKGKTVKPSKMPLVFSIIGILLAASIGGAVVFKDKIPFVAKLLSKKEGAPVAMKAPKSALDIAMMADAPAAAEPEAKPAAASPPSGGAYAPEDKALWQMVEKSASVSVEGIVRDIRQAGTNNVVVEFEKPQGVMACGYVPKDKAGEKMTKKDLDPLIGKKVRITGKAEKGQSDVGPRPKILLKQRSDITEL